MCVSRPSILFRIHNKRRRVMCTIILKYVQLGPFDVLHKRAYCFRIYKILLRSSPIIKIIGSLTLKYEIQFCRI